MSTFIIINKENVGDLMSRSNIKQPKKDLVIELTNKLDEVEELKLQMESDTIDYGFQEYIEVDFKVRELRIELAKAVKEVRF